MNSVLASKLKSFFLKEQFNPSIAGIFLNPFFLSRFVLMKNIKTYSHYIGGKTLDLGCGSKPYQKLFESDSYIGLDVEDSGHNHELSKIDVFYDGKTIPFPDNYFDSLVSFEVLQVIFRADEFLSEANRVLKPGGTAIFTVPFVWDEHEQPHDFARYTSFGLKFLFEKNNFRIVEFKKLLPDLRIIFLLTNAFIYKVIRKIIPSRLSMLVVLPFTSIFNILGLMFMIFPGNPDLYFGNIFILAKGK